MDGFVIEACPRHGPGEVAEYDVFRAALKPTVQTYDWIC